VQIMRATRWLAVVTLLGACAAFGSPDIKTSQTYADLSPDALYQRTLAALRDSGLEVTSADSTRGAITATDRFEQRGWAECRQPRHIVRDTEARAHIVAAPESHRELELQASIEDTAEGARLTLAPRLWAMPVDPLATTEKCRTTGVLERQILDAVGAPG
jgi:hypothetical protein